MAASGRQPKAGLRARTGRWLTWISGILASLAAIVAAVASIIAGHQTTVVHQQSRVIVRLNETIKSQRAAAAGRPPDAPATGASGGATLTTGGYLSTQQPTVSNSNYQTGSVTMSAKAYQNSISFECEGYFNQDQPDLAYDVAGNKVFSALVGIPDNASNATGLAETVTFATQSGRQLGRPVTVTLGSPAKVSLNITGVTQLQVTCTGVDQATHQQQNGNDLALGNAAVS
jgi:hypothetical protein